jgi:hypothetical protein
VAFAPELKSFYCHELVDKSVNVGLEDRYVHYFKHIFTREVCYYWVFCAVIAIFLVTVAYSFSYYFDDLGGGG